MKFSIYNTYICFDDGNQMVFNAVSKEFLLLKGYNQINTVELDKIDPDTKEKLVAMRALVEDELDETAELEKFIYSRCSDNTAFILHINPTLDCNFKCWYCYEKHIPGSLMSEKHIQATIRLAKREIEKNKDLKYFDLSFFGGEPLIGFNSVARPIIENIDEICREADVKLAVHFTTNAYLLTTEAIEFLSHYDTSFQITLDGDRESHDKTRFLKGGIGSYDTIVNNIKQAALKGIRVVVRINYTAANVVSLATVIENLKEFPEKALNQITVDLQRVWQDINKEEQNDLDEIIFEYAAALKNAGIRVTSNLSVDSASYPCYGDKFNYVLVNYNGDIYKCTARDFNDDNKVGTLCDDGSVDWIEDRLHCWENAKFSHPSCKKCHIAPICGGGCRRKLIENRIPADMCAVGYSEEDKVRLVTNLFRELYMND